MSIEENKAIVRRYRAAHNTHQLEALDEIVAADLIAHTLLPGLPRGLEGGKIVHRQALTFYPDLHSETDDLIAEGDQVVERWTETGTHTGAAILGVPASGKKFLVTGMSIYRLANGKIVEKWDEMNPGTVMWQLGLPSI